MKENIIIIHDKSQKKNLPTTSQSWRGSKPHSMDNNKNPRYHVQFFFSFFFLDQKTKSQKTHKKNLSVVQPMTIAPPDKHNTSLRVIVQQTKAFLVAFVRSSTQVLIRSTTQGGGHTCGMRPVVDFNNTILVHILETI